MRKHCQRDLGPACCWGRNRAPRRSAVTLIELLIVMGILTLLATLSLGTVKGLLRDQKVTQAARLVEQYIESARVRALTNQRPVAVFLERVAILGANNTPIAGNYTVTRLTIGEVFPPYTGDILDVVGSLTDVTGDGFADQAVFSLDSVLAGFGEGGFIQAGDTLEFEGVEGRFPITAISRPPSNPPTAVVQFANPPLVPGSMLGMVPPAMPVPAAGLNARFRAYRRPTKSMVGAITLPRGTCVDLAASGLGPASAGAADDSIPFGLITPPLTGDTASPRAFSRVALVFSEDGRLSSVLSETSNGATKTFLGGMTSNILYLLVGRSAQVLPATDAAPDLSSTANRQRALVQRSLQSEADRVFSNLMDPSNVWIVCNPFTGEVKSAPVAQVPEAILQNNNATVFDVVRASRALARSGMRDQL
jgi:type II secretory pathway pseudopilin PulG